MPILVGGTVMPPSEKADAELAPLCDITALQLTNTGRLADFNALVEHLINGCRFVSRVPTKRLSPSIQKMFGSRDSVKSVAAPDGWKH